MKMLFDVLCTIWAWIKALFGWKPVEVAVPPLSIEPVTAPTTPPPILCLPPPKPTLRLAPPTPTVLKPVVAEPATSRLHRSAPTTPRTVAAKIEPLAPPAPRKPRGPYKPRVPKDAIGATFRTDVLEQLHTYFICLKAMRKLDPEAYELYSQVGGRIFADDSKNIASGAELSPWWQTHRPSFGCVQFCRSLQNTDKAHYSPALLYFTKYSTRSRPIHLQPVSGDGDIYLLSVFWHVKRKGSPKLDSHITECGVVVRPDGQVQALKTRRAGYNVVQGRRRSNGGGTRKFRVPTIQWGYSNELSSWAHDAARINKEPVMSTPDFIVDLFCMCAAMYDGTSEMIEIRAKKDNMTALFGFAVERSAEFFQDRERTLTPGGSSKRIFHSVKPHTRTRDGVERQIKLHFRGERNFVWNDYNVSISVPGRDHFDYREFEAASHDASNFDFDRSGMIDPKKLGARLETMRTNGVGATR